jgi:hypothetical protein
MSISDKSCRQNWNTHLCSVSFILKITSFKGYVENMVQLDGPQMITRYSTEKNAKNTAIHTHIYGMWYVLLFNGNSGSTNVPQCYIIHRTPVLFDILPDLLYVVQASGLCWWLATPTAAHCMVLSLVFIWLIPIIRFCATMSICEEKSDMQITCEEWGRTSNAFHSWSSPRIIHTNLQSSVLLEAAAVQEVAAALCSVLTSLQWSAAHLPLH